MSEEPESAAAASNVLLEISDLLESKARTLRAVSRRKEKGNPLPPLLFSDDDETDGMAG